MNNKYEEMSDFEINAKVTMLHYNLSGWEYSDNMQQFYHCGVCGNETHNQPVIDYCNNPADMWPIIFEYGIEISPLYRGEWCASYISEYTYNEDPIYGLQFSDANPLRAAAIVFLMLKDGE